MPRLTSRNQIFLERYTEQLIPFTAYGRVIPGTQGKGVTVQSKDRFQFPVNPPEFSLVNRREPIESGLLRLGTVSRPGPRLPREVTFNGFLPSPAVHQFAEWLEVPASEVLDPWTTVNMLREWQQADETFGGRATPIRLVITDAGGLAIWGTITQFNVTVQGGQVGDVSYEFAFREVLALPEIRQGAVKKKSKRVNPRPRADRTKVRAGGETLAQVAKRIYGEAGPKTIRGLARVNLGGQIAPGIRLGGKLAANTVLLTPPFDQLSTFKPPKGHATLTASGQTVRST